MTMKNFRVVSLFSGCGGMDLGVLGGFSFLNKKYPPHETEIIFANDFDKAIAPIYLDNFNHKFLIKDIKEIPSEEIPDHDILTSGFPCQSFSIIAQNPKRLGYKDEKGKLFFQMCRILHEKKPTVFIAENVKGIFSANKGAAFPLIIEELERTGYFIKYQLMNAVNYGVPQKRERVFIVGFRNKELFNIFRFPKAVSDNNPVTLGSIVIPEDHIDENFYFSQKAVKGLKDSKHFIKMNKGRAQSLDMPCNTVGAHLAKVSLNSTDPVLCINGNYRMFTPREVARIQSFPETFKLEKSKTALYKALGNAVPPVMMWYITEEVLKCLMTKKE